MATPHITERTECQQCGTCCRKGGPALHREDIQIIEGGYFGCQHLVTIRQGELAYDPVRDRLAPSPQELVKIKGTGGEWTCCFFEPTTSTCGIYANRPLECRLLKCWEPDELLAAIGRETLCRKDILGPGHPALALIAQHEQQCPAESAAEAIADWQYNRKDQDVLARLTELVRQDLIVRHQAIMAGKLPAHLEFILLGRPLFKQLVPLGIILLEERGDIRLQNRP